MLHVTPRSRCALQLFVADRADVLEPQPVVGARVLLQRLLVDVEDGVDALVALHMAGHLPAQREVGLDDFGELLAGVVGVPARPRHHADAARGVGVQVREGQVDVADPRRAVDPDLDADLTHRVVTVVERHVGVHLGGRHLVGPQPDRQLVAQCVEHRAGTSGRRPSPNTSSARPG